MWLCARDNVWRMDGIHGQFSVVLPDQGVCITGTAHYRGAGADILDAVWSEIVEIPLSSRLPKQVATADRLNHDAVRHLTDLFEHTDRSEGFVLFLVGDAGHGKPQPRPTAAATVGGQD